MLTVFPCYAPQDRELARAVSAFLERGADAQVLLEEGEIRAGESLLSKAADGLQAAVIVLLLSPDSVPARWARREWEPALFEQPKEYGARVSTLLLRACEFPALLRREAFFDASQEQLPALRELKRWLMGLDSTPRETEFQPARQKLVPSGAAEMEQLYRTLADAPGIFRLEGPLATPLALEFARQSKRDFEGLIWLSCRDQSLAALAGDMASQLGLTLEGELDVNLRELARFCAQRRLLIVLASAADEAEGLIFGGRSSTLLTATAPNRQSRGKLPPAVSACGNVPFRLPLVSEIAGSEAAGTLKELVSSGLVTQLDLRASRYLTLSRRAKPRAGYSRPRPRSPPALRRMGAGGQRLRSRPTATALGARLGARAGGRRGVGARLRPDEARRRCAEVEGQAGGDFRST